MGKSELEVLEEVRELVRYNWTKHGYWDGQDYCLVGAVNQATDTVVSRGSRTTERRRFRRTPVRTKVIEMIEGEITPFTHIERWNDNYANHGDVMRVLDVLIERLEPKNMEVGKPEKQYTVEPAEPIPGVREEPSRPLPTPEREPAKPEREKVPA